MTLTQWKNTLSMIVKHLMSLKLGREKGDCLTFVMELLLLMPQYLSTSLSQATRHLPHCHYP